MLQSLKPGDLVAIISTARKITPAEVAPAVAVLESWGLRVELGKTIGAEENQFAGPDELRLQDLQQMLNRPEVKAVFCARGGYGTTRFLDAVDFTTVQQQPKWVIGFSDVTALLCQLYNHGLESVHAIMPVLFPRPGSEAAIESLRQVLFGEPRLYRAPQHPFNRFGTAEAPLVGGNLSMLYTLTGTRSEVDFTGKILFLEDLDEYLYHIDRMLVHLKRAGKLGQLAGLIIGQMSDMNDNTVPFGQTAYEIIHSHTRAYSYPVCYEFPVGHEPENLAIVCGRTARLSVSENGTVLEQE